MNKGELVNIRGPFEAQALRVLREIPGLTVVAEPGGAERGIDAILGFAGTEKRVAVEFQRRANPATAWQIVAKAKARPKRPLLLVAGETTSKARAILAEHGIAVVDGLGNAHIELPGLLFHIEGRRRRQSGGATRLRGKAGIVAQALLLQPTRMWHVTELADEAAVSPALAHRVLMRLEGEGIVTAEGTGPRRVRRLNNPTALLDLWAEEDIDRAIRTTAYLLAPTPKRLIAELGRKLERRGIDYALTGAAAGSLVAPFISAVQVVDVWVNATAAPKELCDASGAEPVGDGQNINFLQAKSDAPLAFREEFQDLWVANRFRLYADLRRDPRRGREQADHLRREMIGF